MILFVSAVLLLHCCWAAEVCYPPCGCFQDDPPFDNFPLPDSPQDIDIEWRLYTRRNSADDAYILLNYGEAPPPEFNPAETSVFMVHGWQDFGANYDEMKDRMLEVYDYNIIVVDWQGGSGLLNYWRSASDTRVVGSCSTAMTQYWIDNHGADWSRMYCIGLSLGGQTCGFMGKASNGSWGRITALDPAGPAFWKNETEARLDKTDAQFVDTIHTDGFQAGMGYNISHVDFYPNKGVHPQPPCQIGLCSHAISRRYYLASIDSSHNCTFQANPCSSSEDADNGQCETCSSGVDCQRMGFYARSMPGRGSFFLRTLADYPFCEDPANAG